MSTFLKLTNGKPTSATVQGTDIGSGSATSIQFLAADGSGSAAFRSLASGDLPTITLTSDVTGSATSGSIATTVAKIQGMVVSGTTGTTNVVFSVGPTLSNPVVGTQAQSDNSTKAASTAFVTTAISNAISGINPAVAVQAATTSSSDTSSFTYNNGVSGVGATLTSNSNNTPLTVDGFTFTTLGQRLLVKDNSTPANNGIYYVTQVQASLLPIILTRSLDFDQPSDINNTGAIPVINGTVNGTTSWVVTSTVNTVGVDPITFAKFTRNPADYLLKANNLSDVASASTSFNNISPVTTTGDLIIGTGTSTSGRLGIGTNNTVLTSNATTASWNLLTNSNLSGTAAISNANLAAMTNNTVKGNTSGSSATPSDLTLTSNATASSVMYRDTNANTRINSLIDGFTTTATAGATTTLTVASTYTQQFTGSTTQTVVLPDATTLVIGQQFAILNRSTGVVTVNANGGGLVVSMAGNSQTIVTVTSVGTSAGVWDSAYTINPSLTSLGIRAGKQSISSGVTTQAVTFSTAYANTNYAVTCNFLNTTDSAPQYQPIDITAVSTTGFTVSWNSPTITANYILSWQAISNN